MSKDKINYYTKHVSQPLVQNRAAILIKQHWPAVARPASAPPGFWLVNYLSGSPVQPGQTPFKLTEIERAILEINEAAEGRGPAISGELFESEDSNSQINQDTRAALDEAINMLYAEGLPLFKLKKLQEVLEASQQKAAKANDHHPDLRFAQLAMKMINRYEEQLAGRIPWAAPFETPEKAETEILRRFAHRVKIADGEPHRGVDLSMIQRWASLIVKGRASQ